MFQQTHTNWILLLVLALETLLEWPRQSEPRRRWGSERSIKIGDLDLSGERRARPARARGGLPGRVQHRPPA